MELVESGSPQAMPMFRCQITYLSAYFDLMAMRMPDRLSVSFRIDSDLRPLRFPPMALLTLVENAIRNGSDLACEETASRSVRAVSMAAQCRCGWRIPESAWPRTPRWAPA